ncbi:hypothetical protein MRX96_008371 [Rhipicephalus microplus]
MAAWKGHSAFMMATVGSAQGIPQQGQGSNRGTPRNQKSAPFGPPLPSPQHPCTCCTAMQPPRARSSAAPAPSRKTPRSSQKKSNSLPKKSTTNVAVGASCSSAMTSGRPALNSIRCSPSYQQPSPLDNAGRFHSGHSTSPSSQTSYGAPLPSAFYFGDIPRSDRVSEAERFVRDVWRE